MPALLESESRASIVPALAEQQVNRIGLLWTGLPLQGLGIGRQMLQKVQCSARYPAGSPPFDLSPLQQQQQELLLLLVGNALEVQKPAMMEQARKALQALRGRDGL